MERHPPHQHMRLVLLRVEVFVRHHRHKRYRRIVEERTLIPNGVTTMNPVTVSIGHTVSFSILYLDASGNPMLVTPTPDSPPVWANAPSPAGATTFTVGPGGLTASDVAVAAGTDTISLTVVVGGVTFTATDGVTVSPAPQVLTSIAIAASVQ